MQHEVFELRGEFIELNKLLKAVGVCGTGGEAKQLISQGQVSVDGEIETRRRCKLRQGQKVGLDGITISLMEG